MYMYGLGARSQSLVALGEVGSGMGDFLSPESPLTSNGNVENKRVWWKDNELIFKLGDRYVWNIQE